MSRQPLAVPGAGVGVRADEGGGQRAFLVPRETDMNGEVSGLNANLWE